MALKVFPRGGSIVLNDGSGESYLPVQLYNFTVDSSRATILNIDVPNWSFSDAIANIQDESGTAIGTETQVREYLAGLINTNDSIKKIGYELNLPFDTGTLWGGFPITFDGAASISVSSGQQGAVTYDSTETASNATELIDILNEIQNYFVFSYYSESIILVTSGVWNVEDMNEIILVATLDTYEYTSFVQYATKATSNNDAINQQTKNIKATNAAIYDVLAPKSDATVSSVTSVATTDTLLLAANEKRSKVYVFNNSTSTLFIKYGTGASAASFTHKVIGLSVDPIVIDDYKGVLHFYHSALNGTIEVTETHN